LGWGKLGLKGWEVGIDRRVRVVWFGPKTENRAAGARFSRTNRGGGARSWVAGTYLGPGKPGLRSWELGIDGRTRVEGFGGETKSRAAVARFSRTNRGGPLKWVKETYLGLGKPGSRSWELGIDGRTRVEGFGGGGNQK
jgi:hypothetical protein